MNVKLLVLFYFVMLALSLNVLPSDLKYFIYVCEYKF